MKLAGVIVAAVLVVAASLIAAILFSHDQRQQLCAAINADRAVQRRGIQTERRLSLKVIHEHPEASVLPAKKVRAYYRSQLALLDPLACSQVATPPGLRTAGNPASHSGGSEQGSTTGTTKTATPLTGSEPSGGSPVRGPGMNRPPQRSPENDRDREPTPTPTVPAPPPPPQPGPVRNILNGVCKLLTCNQQ